VTDEPLVHSRYTLWTLVGSSLVVVAGLARAVAGPSVALVAAAAWAGAVALALTGSGPAASRSARGRGEDAVPEEG
jgi:hypothetical protein